MLQVLRLSTLETPVETDNVTVSDLMGFDFMGEMSSATAQDKLEEIVTCAYSNCCQGATDEEEHDVDLNHRSEFVGYGMRYGQNVIVKNTTLNNFIDRFMKCPSRNVKSCYPLFNEPL